MYKIYDSLGRKKVQVYSCWKRLKVWELSLDFWDYLYFETACKGNRELITQCANHTLLQRRGLWRKTPVGGGEDWRASAPTLRVARTPSITDPLPVPSLDVLTPLLALHSNSCQNNSSRFKASAGLLRSSGRRFCGRQWLSHLLKRPRYRPGSHHIGLAIGWIENAMNMAPVCQTIFLHFKGCDRAAMADKACSMSYLSAQRAVVLDLGSERHLLQLILTRIRDIICFHPRAHNLIFKV